MLDVEISVDTAKFNKLQTKFQKYGPYAMKQGLKAMNDYMNTGNFKAGIYPQNQNGSPFIWSSEKQRRFVFATVDLPYSRTGGLGSSGKFTVNEQWYTIDYSNSLSWWIYVLHPSYQIIGHRMRGWIPINRFVVNKSGEVVKLFKPAAIAAWEEMEAFMFGGGAGL